MTGVYLDYNATAPQSDYGENLHVLLDFLRLKAAYERDNWRMRPLVLVHEVLCRRGRPVDAAGTPRAQTSRPAYTIESAKAAIAIGIGRRAARALVAANHPAPARLNGAAV